MFNEFSLHWLLYMYYAFESSELEPIVLSSSPIFQMREHVETHGHMASRWEAQHWNQCTCEATVEGSQPQREAREFSETQVTSGKLASLNVPVWAQSLSRV